MPPRPLPSNPKPEPGTVQILGASPRPRTIAALCTNDNEAWFALTGKDLHSLPVPGSPAVLSAGDLVEAVLIEGTIDPAHPDTVQLADLSRSWDEDDAVYLTLPEGRKRPGKERMHGKLTGIHGLVRIKTQNGFMLARGLLEIRFNGEPGTAQPEQQLGPHDLGALISLVSGGPCGILVAGAGAVGYAVPLRLALADCKLRLGKLPTAGTEATRGREAIDFEVARTVELDLGEPPELADAA